MSLNLWGDKLEGLRIKAEWYFHYDDGSVMGPFFNAMTAGGLSKFAEVLTTIPAPFIVIGDGTGELFRKAVGAIIQSGAVLRFRSTLSLSEGNGDFTWASVYSDATAQAGSGIKLNQLDQVFSKNSTQVLNIECKFTLQQGA